MLNLLQFLVTLKLLGPNDILGLSLIILIFKLLTLTSNSYKSDKAFKGTVVSLTLP